MTFKVIPLLQAFSSAIRRTFVQYFTRFQLTARRAVPQRQLGFLYCIVYVLLDVNIAKRVLYYILPVTVYTKLQAVVKAKSQSNAL